MRNSQQHCPRGDFRGARREHPRQGGGGRRKNYRRSEHPEGERQGPPQARGPRRQHRPEARGNSEQHRPRARRNRRRARQENFRPHHPMSDFFLHHNRRRHVFEGRFAFGGRKNRKRKSGWHPSIEFSVFEDRFEVIVELPGVSQDSVNVSVTNKLLIVKGKKQRKQTDEKHKVRRSELRYGRFKRVLPLPPSAKADGIKAEFKDGVLTIVIPKKEDAKPTEIPINADV